PLKRTPLGTPSKALANGNPLDRIFPRLLANHSRPYASRRGLYSSGPNRVEPASRQVHVRRPRAASRYNRALPVGRDGGGTPPPLRGMRPPPGGGLRGGSGLPSSSGA